MAYSVYNPVSFLGSYHRCYPGSPCRAPLVTEIPSWVEGASLIHSSEEEGERPAPSLLGPNLKFWEEKGSLLLGWSPDPRSLAALGRPSQD